MRDSIGLSLPSPFGHAAQAAPKAGEHPLASLFLEQAGGLGDRYVERLGWMSQSGKKARVVRFSTVLLCSSFPSPLRDGLSSLHLVQRIARSGTMDPVLEAVPFGRSEIECASGSHNSKLPWAMSFSIPPPQALQRTCHPRGCRGWQVAVAPDGGAQLASLHATQLQKSRSTRGRRLSKQRLSFTSCF